MQMLAFGISQLQNGVVSMIVTNKKMVFVHHRWLSSSCQLIIGRSQASLSRCVSDQQGGHPFLVSTRSRHQISATFIKEETSSGCFHIPLTVSDVHLRHEQLPFAYFFRETLDAQLLKCSLRRVLRHFPVVSGKVLSQTFQAVHCDPSRDTIPLAFGDVNATLDEWLSEARGHLHVPGHGHPILLPLFDALFEENDSSLSFDNLAKIRVTHFQCGGTAIGVNVLHTLGDTASCVRFVQCWGREMQQLEYPVHVSNRRANVCVSGMMTAEIADLMGLAPEQKPIFDTGAWRDWWLPSSWSSVTSTVHGTYSGKLPEEVPGATEAEMATNESRHEYLQLRFSSKVLNAMKEVGMAAMYDDQKQLRHHEIAYVSTNDLVTAFGWLLKRALSGEHSSNISMVVNMRGRCGVESFKDMTELIEQGCIASDDHCGLFGNGITNFIAEHPPTNKTFDIWDVVGAAGSIRLALTNGMTHLPERMFRSRMGKASSTHHSSTAMAFPTTSWGQFPLWDVSFTANKNLVAFHGHPSHPLPPGQSTYSSVIMKTLHPSTKLQGGASVDTREYGMKFNLLLPSENVEKARQKHQEVCASFLSARSQMQRQGSNETMLRRKAGY
jgi:Transferase family